MRIGYTIVLLSILCFGMVSCKKDAKEIPYKFGPTEDYFVSKYHASHGYFNWKSYMQSIADLNALPQSSARSGIEWQLEGPGNIGARANTLAIHPTNPNIMYIGFSEGGAFRTRDGGVSWEPIFDDQLTLSIGKITIDERNPNIVYIGTGDPNVSGYPFVGNGLYKSINGGDTWSNIGLENTRIISDIAIDPNNSNVLYVGTMGIPFYKDRNRGLYKSSNGGVTWQQTLFINDSTGISNVVIDPSESNTIYVSTWNRIRNNKTSIVKGDDGGVFKSIDGGQNWTRLEGGLPLTNNSRVGIDISKSNPNILYAIIASGEDYNIKGIYKTDDGGASWTNVAETALEFDENWYAGFGWYFTSIRINPKDPNDVFVLAVDLYRTKDGGASWELACPPWYFYEVHADKHDLKFAGDHIYLCTDGGAYKRPLESEFWEDIENIPTTQFYRVVKNPHLPDIFVGGAQDNGTSSGNLSSIYAWERVFGGDGFQPVFDPSNPDLMYVMTQNGGIYVSKDRGQFFDDATLGIEPGEPTNWDAPLVISNKDGNILYTGTNKVYKNSSGPDPFWVAVSDTLTDPNSDFYRHDISTIDTYNDIIAVGTSDGLVWISTDDGNTWESMKDLPSRYVSDIHIAQDETIVVAFSSFKDGDNAPYIFVSEDKGKSWLSLQHNLPLSPINTVERFDFQYKNQINTVNIIGTNTGVYWMVEGQDTWMKFGANFPNVAVYDLVYDAESKTLVAGSFGRGIYSLEMENVFAVTSDDEVTPKIHRFHLKPNVVTTFLEVSAQGALVGQRIEIISPQGQSVLTATLQSIDQSVDVTRLSAGVYYCKIGTDIKPFLKVY